MIYYVGKDINDTYRTISIDNIIEYFKDKDEIAFDTETTGLSPQDNSILLYQLGDADNQFTVNAKDYPLDLFKDLLEDENKTILMHHAAFDLGFLFQYKILPKNIWDTYLAEAVLYKGNKKIRKSLDETVYRYCKITLDKSIRGMIHKIGITNEVIKYGAEDVAHLHSVKRHQYSLLTKKDLLLSMQLENAFVKVLAYTSFCGIYLNKNEWIAKVQEDYDNMIKYKEQLDDYIIKHKYAKYIDQQLSFDFVDTKQMSCTVNWASPLQVAAVFKDIGIDIVNDENKESIDIRNLKFQIDKFDILPIYIKYKKYEKAISTYGMSVLKTINPSTKRIHTVFNQVMDTGRISSGDKRRDKNSINLQNIPAEERTRQCFQAQGNNVFIDADYSGQEQVIFANFTQEPNLIKFYQDELGDMHSYIASLIYPELKDVPLSEIKSKHPELRQRAKAAGFAINYGGTGHTIANNLNISEEEGNNIYKKYFEAFPEVDKYFKKVTKDALSKGHILINTLIKSKCYIFQYHEFLQLSKQVSTPGFWANYKAAKQAGGQEFEYFKPVVSRYWGFKGEITRMALNYPIQGTGAEMMKMAAILFFKYLVEHDLLFKVYIVNLIHDEILIETPKELALELKPVLQDCMEKAGSYFCKTVPIKANPVISNHWTH